MASKAPIPSGKRTRLYWKEQRWLDTMRYIAKALETHAHGGASEATAYCGNGLVVEVKVTYPEGYNFEQEGE